MTRLGVVLGAFAALAWAATAFAHAEPSRATPGDGAVVNTPPTEVVLVMTQEMARQAGANGIDVFDASGREVTTEEATVDANDRRRLTVRLPADLPPGTYVVRWRTLSADDGDTASGELSFRIDPAATPSPGREQLQESVLGGAPTPPARPPGVAATGDDGAGWVLAAGVGGVLFVLGVGAGAVLSRRAE